jgi:hypothetical protein
MGMLTPVTRVLVDAALGLPLRATRYTVERARAVPMPDGVPLVGDHYRPVGVQAGPGTAPDLRCVSSPIEVGRTGGWLTSTSGEPRIVVDGSSADGAYSRQEALELAAFLVTAVAEMDRQPAGQ